MSERATSDRRSDESDTLQIALPPAPEYSTSPINFNFSLGLIRNLDSDFKETEGANAGLIVTVTKVSDRRKSVACWAMIRISCTVSIILSTGSATDTRAAEASTSAKERAQESEYDGDNCLQLYENSNPAATPVCSLLSSS